MNPKLQLLPVTNHGLNTVALTRLIRCSKAISVKPPDSQIVGRCIIAPRNFPVKP